MGRSNNIEGNRIIAEYMGAERQQWYEPTPMYNQSGVHYSFQGMKTDEGHWSDPGRMMPDNQRYHADSLLRYDKSWEWLMPVVGKILSEPPSHALAISMVYEDNREITLMDKARELIKSNLLEYDFEWLYINVLIYIGYHNIALEQAAK